MDSVENNRTIRQRVLYTLCFFALCLIDWANGSLNGRAQMTATNMTGIVLAIIFFSTKNIKELLKPVYYIWLVINLLVVPIAVRVILPVYPYKGQVVSGALNISLYGLALIWVISNLIKTKRYTGLRIPVFVSWLAMLIMMLLSVNENIWPIWYAVVFGAFYYTEIDSDREKSLYLSIPDGIILGFFAIQGMALLFRPYDVVRYCGLYVNPNFNALFYLMSYSALLCKLYILKKEGKSTVFRIFLGLLAGSMYGFCIFTGSKTAILAMILVTIPFSLMMLKYHKNKIISFVCCWLFLGVVGIVSIPVVYGSIRYMPTIHLHPLYFEGEYSLAKIQPGEPRDSEKYITFENAMEKNMGRYFYKFPKLKEFFNSFLTLKVYAAEPMEFQEPEYIFTDEEVASGIDPIDMRNEIHKYYFDRLNWIGHRNDYDPAPIHRWYSAPHAHNVFIQMAFLYGIPAGILFLGMILAFIPGCISLMKAGEDFRVFVISCFVIAFVAFGFFEIDWMCGQLPFTMIFLMFRDVVRKPYNLSSTG